MKQVFKKEIFLFAAIWSVSLFSLSSVYFSPQDNIREVIFRYMQKEKASIKVASYWVTDKDFIQELINAVERGVEVEMIVDRETLSSTVATLRKNIERLRNAGVKVYVYQALYGIMHNKFCIFEKNKGCDKLERAKGRSIVYTGSFNLTWKANYVNQENVCFMDDSEIVQKYKERFEKIKDEVFLLQENLTGARRSIYTKKDVSQGKLEKKTNEQANILDEPSSLCDENDDESENFDGLAFEF